MSDVLDVKTFQDLEHAKAAGKLESFILDAIKVHKLSPAYNVAFDAEEYDRQRNVTIMKYQKVLYTLSGKAVPDNYSANYKLCSNFFNRFVTQENQYLLGNGVYFSKESSKTKMGKDLDYKIQQLGRNALVQGVSFGFWNFDHIEVFKLTEFVPLYDEENSALKAGIRFWQVSRDKPLRATLYEIDGYTDYIKYSGEEIRVLNQKRNYIQRRSVSVADGEKIYNFSNYPSFPIVPLWGNLNRQSELVGLRESIDCYDLIRSGFANDLDDASMIYWTLQNAGGMDDVSLAQFVERMKTVKAAVVDGDSGAKAEAHTLEVPYQSRMAYLERLEHDMYRDAQILNIDSLSASAKTATEITAAYQPMDNKVDQYEYCVLEFLNGIFSLAGIDDVVSFKRSKITNQLEETQMILMAAQYLDDEAILSKLPWLTPEEVREILDRNGADAMKRFGLDDGENFEEEKNAQ